MKKDVIELDIINLITFIVGIFISALCFNMFLNANNLVVSGFSGIAIVVEKFTGLTPSIFLFVTNIILLFICYFTLGWKETKINIFGSILYPLMVSITAPLAIFLLEYIATDDFLLTMLFAIITYGVGAGLIYRAGYVTGGSDIIMQIINKFFRIQESKSMLIANSLVIICGIFVFGIEKGTYSFIILFTSTFFIDKLMFGTSDSKLFYIYTKKIRKVKHLIMYEFNNGFTTIPSHGGYTKKNGNLIMCVVSNGDYYNLKQRILEIDPKAFIIINKCFEVNGGVKKSTIPFF